ncbi:phage tail sheath subtilisin-like domain-containing protein [Xenorhabdus sp. XENO-10]|uniref:Phage tail sheath subtilisin-like domain-containing protein n=1 Tax=Xenorhabdus yunnanensis TaxID=3025878 RepID=A0ABT5LMV9_9GAMM|nr:phage tail sheath subtilisin-like domain-containing protein [Xenorhabdus yunnanensis]MDC9591120.1 phage tail sheath subtilisin-like domain-containing protein [Xenorhabdus yunnanensis]
MPAILKAPGVYIEEDASLALSVNHSATAVPVFIGKFTPKTVDSTQVCTRISNWLEFTSTFSLAPMTEIVIRSSIEPSFGDKGKKEGVEKDKAENKDVVKDKKEEVEKKETKAQETYQAETFSATEEPPKWVHYIEEVNLSKAVETLRLYFQNGGGACYIYSLNDFNNPSALTAIPEVIEQKGDVTLLVCAEDNQKYKTNVYEAVRSLLNDNKVGYFLIADSPDGESVPSVGNRTKVAAYYPQLETNLKFSTLPDDQDVLISGYGYEDKSGKDKMKTLEKLRETDNALAQKIDARLQQQQQRQLTLPPSAAIAGIYCQTDNQRGVWKAPANVALTGVKDLTDKVDDDRQGAMNNKGINVIRSFTDRGLMVWGARTCTDVNDTHWRYIPVRRLFNSVERDIRQALRAVLFETNNQPTWMRAKAAVDQYLYALWQKNALMGDRPEEAYFVHIGQDITMSDADIKQGKMIMKVGLAAVRPAEFIVLQFTQDVAQ